MKRGSTGLSGILAIDKPAGITSHDVVDRVRRITGERRVGHAGTLDPAASGLMLVAVGAATRLSTYLTGHDKRYLARIVFGVATDTDDAQGRVTEHFARTAPGLGLEVLEGLDEQATLAELEGEHRQLPPAYSAIKKGGVTAYKAAREGKKLELEARPIHIHEAQFLARGTTDVQLALPDDEQGESGAFSARLVYWDCALHVSKGTYIRAIARDLGQHLGCGAHLGALRRIAVGGLSLDAACTLEQLAQRAAEGALPWCDPAALLGFERRQLSERDAAKVANGGKIDAAGVPEMGLVSCVRDDRLIAVYQCRGGALCPATVIPGGVCGVA